MGGAYGQLGPPPPMGGMGVSPMHHRLCKNPTFQIVTYHRHFICNRLYSRDFDYRYGLKLFSTHFKRIIQRMLQRLIKTQLSHLNAYYLNAFYRILHRVFKLNAIATQRNSTQTRNADLLMLCVLFV
ncbi:hypothetical protein HanPI659440_Chr01g0011371 [Helianthus annuus]|nr:hypothetical protein HanPI659440_Chr01g0011371 [Helianthus annuus]